MILVVVCDNACFASLPNHEKLTRKRRQLKLWNSLVTNVFMLCSAISMPFNPPRSTRPAAVPVGAGEEEEQKKVAALLGQQLCN